MKTIEEQAQEYAETKTLIECGYILTARNAFIAGAKAATRWIPAETFPPDHHQKLLSLSTRGMIRHSFGGALLSDNKIIQDERKDPDYYYWKYWLPIPPMPEK